MENFEESLRKLLADKATGERHPLEPSQRAALEVLLEHICEKALIPAHRILTAQEVFAGSTLNNNDWQEVDDDDLEERKMVNLTMVRNKQSLFEYRLSFRGDTIWREVQFSLHPMRRDQIPADFLDDVLFDKEPSAWQENMPGRTVLPESVVGSFSWQEYFPLDMAKAVRLVQEDFYWVCETVL